MSASDSEFHETPPVLPPCLASRSRRDAKGKGNHRVSARLAFERLLPEDVVDEADSINEIRLCAPAA
jgi:hypothetical protein